MSGDIHWDEVDLLLNFNGADENTFVNKKNNNLTLRGVETLLPVNFSSNVKKFGTGSFRRSSNDFIYFDFDGLIYSSSLTPMCLDTWIYLESRDEIVTIFIFRRYIDNLNSPQVKLLLYTGMDGRLYFNVFGRIIGVQTSTTSFMTLNQWHHVRLTYDPNALYSFDRLKIYVNGINIDISCEYTSSPFPDYYDEIVVSDVGSSGSSYIDDYRLTFGDTRNDDLKPDGTFNVPTAAYPIMSSTGVVSGVVKISDVVVANKQVRLYRKDTGDFVKEIMSGGDGSFSFDNLPNEKEYFVVIHDTSGTYNAVVSDSLITLPFAL